MELILAAEELLLQLSEQQLDAATEGQRAEGEGSTAQGAVPRAVSNKFMQGADRKNDFAVTYFGLCVSVDS